MTDEPLKITYHPPATGSQAWFDAIDYPERLRAEVKRNRLKDWSKPLPEPSCTTKAGYVYVIRDLSTGLYKIGRTANLDRRMKELGVGKTATLVRHRFVSDASEAEKTAHRRYKDQRLPQTEYFKLASVPQV